MEAENLERMLAQGGDSHMLRFALGMLCLKKKLFEDAIVHLGRAVTVEPGHSASWKGYAKALAEAGRVDEARDAYEKGIQVAQSRGDLQAVKEMKVFLNRLGA
jgi:uncharacterized protein HemY